MPQQRPRPDDELSRTMGNPYVHGSSAHKLDYQDTSQKFDQSTNKIYEKVSKESSKNDNKREKAMRREQKRQEKRDKKQFKQQNSQFSRFMQEMNNNKQNVLHSNENILTKVWLMFLITLKIILYPFAKVLEPFARFFGKSYEFLLAKVIPFFIIILLVFFLGFRGALYFATYSRDHGMTIVEGFKDNFKNLFQSISESFSNSFKTIAKYALNDFYDDFFPEPEVEIEDEGLDVGLNVEFSGLNMIDYYNDKELTFYGDIELTTNSNNPVKVETSCYVDSVDNANSCKVNSVEGNFVKTFYSQIPYTIKVTHNKIEEVGTHKLNIVNSFKYNSSTSYSISFVDEDYYRVLRNQNNLADYSAVLSKTASNPVVLGFNFPNKPIIIRKDEGNYYFHIMLENNWEGKFEKISNIVLRVPNWVEDVNCGLLEFSKNEFGKGYVFYSEDPNWFKSAIEDKLGRASFLCTYDINAEEFYEENQNQQEAKGTFRLFANYDYQYKHDFSFVIKDFDTITS